MLDRRTVTAALLAGAATSIIGAGKARAQTQPLTPARNVVLVHGLYADGSCWLRVIPLLQQVGLNVTAVQNPLRSLDEDCEFTRRTLTLQDGPTVLVAHSYGGEVVTQTGGDPKVSALVYCSARAPDANEDYTALAKPYPTPPASAGLVHANGCTKPCFYQVSSKDRTINPDLQRFMAKRMKAKTIEIESSHLGIISHPREIANLILEAAGHAT